MQRPHGSADLVRHDTPAATRAPARLAPHSILMILTTLTILTILTTLTTLTTLATPTTLTTATTPLCFLCSPAHLARRLRVQPEPVGGGGDDLGMLQSRIAAEEES